MIRSRPVGADRTCSTSTPNQSKGRGMATTTRNGSGLILVAIVAVLACQKVPSHGNELAFTVQTVIDEYTYDKGKRPQSLRDLVNEGYLRADPADPRMLEMYAKSIERARNGTNHS